MHYHTALYTAVIGLSALALGAPTPQEANLLSRQSAPVRSSLSNFKREDDGVFVADGFKRRSDDDASGVNKDDGVFVADGFKRRDQDDTSVGSTNEDGVFVADGFKKRDDDDGVFVADGF